MLDGAQAPQQRTISLVADGRHGGQDTGRAPSSAIAGGRQSGDRSGTGMAQGRLAIPNKSVKICISPLAFGADLCHTVASPWKATGDTEAARSAPAILASFRR